MRLRKLLSILLAACLVIGLMPAGVLAEEMRETEAPTVEYADETAAPAPESDEADPGKESDGSEAPEETVAEVPDPDVTPDDDLVGADDETPCLWICGQEVAVDSSADIFGDGTVVYDDATHTVTLTDADISGATYDHDGVIYTEYMDLNVVYHGDNKLNADRYIGIKILYGNVTIIGDGSLTIRGTYTGGKADRGITAWQGSIFIGGTGTLDIKSTPSVISSDKNGLTIADNLAITTPANGRISSFYGDEIEDPYSSGWVEEVVIRPRPAYTVTIEDAQNGRVIVSSSPADAGETINLAFEPKPNYEPDTLTVYETASGASVDVVDNAFTMPAADVTVTGTFRQKLAYDLSAYLSYFPDHVSAAFFVDGKEVSSAAEGETVTAVFTADEGYEVYYIEPEFRNWLDGYSEFKEFSDYYPGEENPTYEVDYDNASVTFVMPHTDVRVTARPQQLYQVDTSAVEHAVVASDQNWYHNNDTVHLTVSSIEDGYALDSLTVRSGSGDAVDVTQEENDTYSFKMPEEDVIVDAEFSVNMNFGFMKFCEHGLINSVGKLNNTGASRGTATISVRNGGFVLTLNDFHYTGGGHNANPPQDLFTYDGYADFTIELIGENVLTQTGSYDTCYGFMCNHSNLTIEGDGSLEITSANGQSSSYGILANTVTVRNTEVSVTAGSAAISYGIKCNSMDLENSDLTVQGGDTGLSGSTTFRTPVAVYAGDTAPGEHINRSNIGDGYKYIRVATSDDTWILPGSGTEDDPYMIRNVTDWETLADYYSGTYSDLSFTGKVFKLSDDFDNSDSPTNSNVGCYDCRFDGVFDGNGRTLTIALTNGNSAPFAQIEGAVIKNLTVDGSIEYSGSYFGGITMYAWGDNRISNCIVSADITSTMYSVSGAGGFVGSVKNGEMVIEDSAFYGSLLGENAHSGAGFVGTTNTGEGAVVRLNNVFFAPEQVTLKEEGSCTFARSDDLSKSPVLSHAYYTQTFGTVQGTKVTHPQPDTGLYGRVTAPDGEVFYLPVSIELSDVDLWDTDVMDSLTYTITGDEIDPIVEGTDYEASYTRNDTTDGIEYTLVITGTGRLSGSYERHFKMISGSGTEEDPFVISNAGEWETLVSDYLIKDLSGKHFMLSDTFDNSEEPVTGTLGTEGYRFSGTFDGNGRELTVALDGESDVAPFAFIENAEIKNLTVTGSIKSNGLNFGGIAGNSYGNNTIEGCTVLAEIRAAYDDTSRGGGFLGAVVDGSTEIRDSVFAGSLRTFRMVCGGFVGYVTASEGTSLALDNVLFIPKNNLEAKTGNCTFVCMDADSDVSITKAYYVEAYGNVQGTQVYPETPETGLYIPVTAADGGTYYIYLTVKGVKKAYAYTGDSVSVLPVVSDAEGNVYSEGESYSVTVEPEEIREVGSYTMTFTGKGAAAGQDTVTFEVRDEYMTYLETDGTESTTVNYQMIHDGGPALWEDDVWYYPAENMTINSRVQVSGNTNLILTDGVTLTIPQGISVTGDNSLTIWWQTGKTGVLVIDGAPAYSAGIGGDSSASGLITINGGDITVTGGPLGAAIGGGYNGTGNVVIAGGKVTAIPGAASAGIGGGNLGIGNVTITGGLVRATGGQSGAGIGGGMAAIGNVSISGGEIIADGGVCAAGIGNGNEPWQELGFVNISGGSVTATGGRLGAGVGSGQKSTAVVNISGGTVTAQGGDYASGIGSGSEGKAEIVIDGGEIHAKGGASGAGIGGGRHGDAEVTINDGDIEAVGGDGGAGVGSGTNDLGKVTILGGNIIASGNNGSAGIGGGRYGEGDVTICGGTVSATGGDNAPAIGGGQYLGGSVNIQGGKVTASAGSNAPAIGGDPEYDPQITLSWTTASDSITTVVGSGNGGFVGTVTLEKAFTDGTDIYEAGEVADNSVLADKTLVPYEGVQPEDEEPVFVKHSLALGGKIGVNFFLKLPEAEGIDYSEGYMEFSVSGKNGETITVPYSETSMNTTGELYGFTCPVNAIQMADEIRAVFHYKQDGEDKTAEETYSVRQYVESYADLVEELNASEADAGDSGETLEELNRMLPLVKALADYGHYAQIYLADQRGWSLGEDHAVMDIFYTDGTGSDELEAICQNLEPFAIGKSLNTEDIEKLTCSLVLDSGTAINLYVKPVKSYKGSVTATVDGTTSNPKKQKDGRYKLAIDDIGAHELGKMYDVVVTTGENSAPSTISVSALSYVKAMLDKAAAGTASQEATDAMAALYRYYEAAAAVLGQ